MSVLDQHLADFDPEVAELIGKELERQRNGLEMIASENHAPLAVMQAQGSVLTNKYAAPGCCPERCRCAGARGSGINASVRKTLTVIRGSPRIG